MRITIMDVYGDYNGEFDTIKDAINFAGSELKKGNFDFEYLIDLDTGYEYGIFDGELI